MMTKRRRKKNLRFVIVLFLLLSLGAVQAKAERGRLSIFGGWSRVFASGSEADYRPGENDFPVTPAHSPFQLGFALGIIVNDQIGVELDYRTFLSSRLTLEDPSDLDTVEVDSSRHYALAINGVYRILEGRLSPYILAGGGFEKLSAQDKTYTSEFGFDVEFSSPEKTTHGMANLGGGILFSALKSLMIRLDVRYSLIFSDPQQRILSLSMGFMLSF
jgi:opacity protein-like surface antigen